MPKDYSTAIIYKIWSNNTGRCYVGSTVQKLPARMRGHKSDYKFFKENGKIKCSSSFIYEDGDIEYKCIAKNPCENLEQLHRAEGFYQKKIKCVNILRAGRTDKEYYLDNKGKIKKQRKEHYQNNKEKLIKNQKEHYQNNKEKLIKYQKEYRQKNKEKIKKRDKENKVKKNKKNNCLCCKGKYTTQNWTYHAKAKKHVKAQALQEQLQDLIPLYHQ